MKLLAAALMSVALMLFSTLGLAAGASAAEKPSAPESGGIMHGGDMCLRQGSPGGIGNRARQSGTIHLRRRPGREAQDDPNKAKQSTDLWGSYPAAALKISHGF
jgi:hypothetical protein